MNYMEIWRDIIGYEGIYQISNLGNVKRIGTYKKSKLRAWYNLKVSIKRCINRHTDESVLKELENLWKSKLRAWHKIKV